MAASSSACAPSELHSEPLPWLGPAAAGLGPDLLPISGALTASLLGVACTGWQSACVRAAWGTQEFAYIPANLAEQGVASGYVMTDQTC